MTGSDCPKGLREEHDNIQNFMAVPTTSLGQCFGENLGFFCKLSPLIHVTNGASRSYHIDDTTFNYRGIKSHISFYYWHRRSGVFVGSHLALFSVFLSVHSKRTPGLYGLKYFKLEFPIQAQIQRNLTCHKRSMPPKE